MDSPVHIARLGRPIGLEGDIVLIPMTDRCENLLSQPGDYRLLDGRTVRVKELIQRGARWLWRLDADDPAKVREYAGRFTNAIVVVNADELPAREDGSFSEYELVGMEVHNADGTLRGQVIRVEERHGFDAWIVRELDGRESELPALSQFIIDIDRSARRVTVHAEGLIR